MLRKPPIRTYQRKNLTKPVAQLYRSQIQLTPEDHTVTLRKNVKPPKPVDTGQNAEVDNSLGYDPFDTTFDRLVKGAVLPPPLPVQNDASWASSSFEKTNSEQELFVSFELSTVLRDNNDATGKVRRKKDRNAQMTIKKTCLVRTPKSEKRKKPRAKRKKGQRHKLAKVDDSKENKADIKHNSKGETICDSKEYFHSLSNPSCLSNNLMNSDINNSAELLKKESTACLNSYSKNNINDIRRNAKNTRKNRKKTCLKTSDIDNSFSLLNNSNSLSISNRHSKRIRRRNQRNRKTANKSIKDISLIVNAWTSFHKEITQNITNYSLQVDVNKETSKLQDACTNVDKVSLEFVNVSDSMGSSKDTRIKPCSVKLEKGVVEKQKMNCDYSFAMINDLLGFSTGGTSIFKTTNNLGTETEMPNSIANEMKDCFVRLDRIKPPLKARAPEKSDQALVCSTPMSKARKQYCHLLTVSPIVHIERLKLHLSAMKESTVDTHVDSESAKTEDIRGTLSSISTVNNEIKSAAEESVDRSTDVCSPEKSAKILDHSKDIHNVELPSTQILTSFESYENLTENSARSDEEACNNVPDITNAQKLQSHFVGLNVSEGSDRTRSLFDDTNNNSNALKEDKLADKPNDTSDSSCASANLTPERIWNTEQLESADMFAESSLEPTNFMKLERLSRDLKESIVSLPLQHTKTEQYGGNNLADSQRNSESENLEIDVKEDIINALKKKSTEDVGLSKISIGRLSTKRKDSDGNDFNRLSVRLRDPFRITDRRKRNRKWNLQLADICENQDDAMPSSNSGEFQSKKLKDTDEDSTSPSASTNHCNNLLATENHCVSQPVRTSVYLKPGKYWARSLSILNNIQNGFNLDDLSVGKGKKWRHSVKDILNMQEQGIIQSCVKNVEDVKGRSTCYGSIHRNSEHALTDKRHCTLDSVGLNRFSRRVSVRVVPDNKNLTCIEDTPFREAYGITGSQSRTSVLPKPRISFQHEIHCSKEDVSIDNIHPATTAREVVLQRCEQEDYLSFAECFPDSYLEHCRKIGEGVYGEVFLYECEQQKSVIKIIPIEGSELVNGEPQKKFDEILSEIVISKELDNLRFTETYNTSGFVRVLNVRCIVGTYPEKLVELWRIFDEEKTSDNDCPSMFDENQLYIVLELGHGGQDLEAFVFQTAVEAYALFFQTALALAVAEKSLEFEHRDLHWGNVLISRTDESYIYYKLDNKEICLPSKGVKVSIIDFTLSRMLYEGCCIFNDLSLDPTLFTAQGEYQFEIYRLMRDRTEDNWQNFEPYTNVLWLHYTLDKMITEVRYKKKTLKMHKKAIADLLELKDVVLDYESAFDFVTNCDKFADQCNNSSPVCKSAGANYIKTRKTLTNPVRV